MDKEVIKRIALGQSSDEEHQAFINWLKKATPEEIGQSMHAFEEFSRHTDQYHKASPQLTSRVMEAVKSKQSKVITLPSRRHWLKYAASVALIAVAGWISVRVFTTQENPNWVSVSVPYGEKREIILSDSSVVWLNAGSTLRYPETFAGNHRTVDLEGEGFFEVKRDENKPFKIRCREIDVTVLGTSFNIKNYEGETTEVAVATGMVQVQGSDDKGVRLTANQLVLYNREMGLSSVSPVDVEQYTSWRDGTLVFTGRNLKQIGMLLEREYGKKIVLKNKDLQHCMPIGVHHNTSLESVLNSLQFVLNIEYRISADSVIIDGGGCKP